MSWVLLAALVLLLAVVAVQLLRFRARVRTVARLVEAHAEARLGV